MEHENVPESFVALYRSLEDAEATLHELEAAGVPYPSIQLATHSADDPDRRALLEQAELAKSIPAGPIWSLTVHLQSAWRDRALALLGKHQPVALGRMQTPDAARDDTERGAIAWRHYVFATSAATDAIGEYAGTTGNTGVISSGAFAEGALVQGLPQAQPEPEQPQTPESDTMRPTVSTDRSRPETQLKQ